MILCCLGVPEWLPRRQPALPDSRRPGEDHLYLPHPLLERIPSAVGRRRRTDIQSVRNYPYAVTTHNLTVSFLHTYYVLAGTTPVLVHNCGGEITIYRGVPENDLRGNAHPGFDEATDGVARPRGGNFSAEDHHAGQTDSPFVSWTVSPKVAYQRAISGKSGNGVVLTAKIPRGMSHVHSNDQSWVQYRSELEVLVEGTLTGEVEAVWKGKR